MPYGVTEGGGSTFDSDDQGNVKRPVFTIGWGSGASRQVVSSSAPLPTSTAPDTALGSNGASGVTIGTTSGSIIAANSARKRVDVSNGSTTGGLWIRPGGGAAVVGQGWYLPPQAQASYYTTLALTAIGTVAGIPVGFVEW